MDHILVCYSEERIEHEGQVIDLLVNLPTQLRWLHLTRMPPGSFPDEFLSFFLFFKICILLGGSYGVEMLERFHILAGLGTNW